MEKRIISIEKNPSKSKKVDATIATKESTCRGDHQQEKPFKMAFGTNTFSFAHLKPGFLFRVDTNELLG